MVHMWKGLIHRSAIEVEVAQQLTAYAVDYKYEGYQFEWSDADTDEIGIPEFTSPDHQTKYKSFVRCFPEYRFYMLFSKDNWIDGAKTQRCSQWYRERGIPFAIGAPVPEVWLR